MNIAVARHGRLIYPSKGGVSTKLKLGFPVPLHVAQVLNESRPISHMAAKLVNSSYACSFLEYSGGKCDL